MKTDKITLKPSRADLIVRDPATREPLSPAGKPVVLDTFWRRRLNAGDVVQVRSPAKPKTEKKDT